MPSATYPHTGQGVLVAKAGPHEMIHNYLKTTAMSKQTSTAGIGQAYLTEHPEGHIP